VIDKTSGTTTASRPAQFARHARAAIEKHVTEARSPEAHWHLGTNEAWVRFPRPDGLFGFFGLRRHLDWVSGEAGIARTAMLLGDLFRLPGDPGREVEGYRARLGDLIDGKDRWWPSGETEDQLDARLGHLALQLVVKGGAHFRRWPGSAR
jgi:hypothetical protein